MNSPFDIPTDKKLRVGIISNPNSGGNRKGLGSVQKILNDYPHVLHKEAKTLPDTGSVLEEFENKGINLVVINGGDGTIQTVLTAIFFYKPFSRMPLISVLRAGTDSSIAKDAGIKGCRDRGLKKLMNWVDTQAGQWEIIRRSIMKVEISSYSHPIYSMIFGAAIIYNAIEFCHKNIYTKGLYGNLATGLTLTRYVLGVILKNKKYRVTTSININLDQRLRLKDDFLLVLITTVEHLIFGLRPFWGMENAPLHVTTIHDRQKHLLKVMSSMALGRNSRYRTLEDGYFSCNANEIRLQVSGGFTLDGELHLPESSSENIVITEGGQVPFLKL